MYVSPERSLFPLLMCKVSRPLNQAHCWRRACLFRSTRLSLQVSMRAGSTNIIYTSVRVEQINSLRQRGHYINKTIYLQIRVEHFIAPKKCSRAWRHVCHLCTHSGSLRSQESNSIFYWKEKCWLITYYVHYSELQARGYWTPLDHFTFHTNDFAVILCRNFIYCKNFYDSLSAAIKRVQSFLWNLDSLCEKKKKIMPKKNRKGWLPYFGFAYIVDFWTANDSWNWVSSLVSSNFVSGSFLSNHHQFTL